VKVNAWKNIDVEFEADVSLEDCINEMIGVANEEGPPRRKLTAIDGATKILERIAPEVFDDKPLHPDAVTMIRDRLQKWIEFLERKPAP